MRWWWPRSFARTWPRWRPACWPRCTPAGSRRVSWRGGRPRSGSPTWPAPTAAPATRPSGRPPVLVNERTATHAAMASGRVSPEQAAVIVDAVDRLPTDPGCGQDGEAFLLDAATRLNATDLAKAAGTWSRWPTPRRAERKAERELERQDRAAHLHRYLSIIEDGAGGIRRPRPGHRRGRGRDQGRPAPAHQAGPGGRPPRPGRVSRPWIRATTAPGCGTPWSRPATTP